MKDLEKGISDALRVRNCLIFLINTCFELDYGDYTDRIGKQPHDLSAEEKIFMLDVLKIEFYN